MPDSGSIMPDIAPACGAMYGRPLAPFERPNQQAADLRGVGQRLRVPKERLVRLVRRLVAREEPRKDEVVPLLFAVDVADLDRQRGQRSNVRLSDLEQIERARGERVVAVGWLIGH